MLKQPGSSPAILRFLLVNRRSTVSEGGDFGEPGVQVLDEGIDPWGEAREF